MSILVTGGAGYIGSHTVKQLLREGFKVVIFDNFSSGKEELIVGGQVIKGDLRNREKIKEVLASFPIEAVIHFASLIQVGESYQNPQKYYHHNLVTSLNLLEAMLENKIMKFIFSSSAAVYGLPKKIPIPENHPLSPANPYGQTKFFVETMLQDYSRAYGLQFISLRYFNAAGADPEGQLGEMHEPETHLIPNILLTLLGKKEKFYLYGTDFPTPDGTAIRDYIHVTDLATAHVQALKKLLHQEIHADFINLGTNKGYSVLEVIRQAEEVTGLKLNYLPRPRRQGDVPILLASREKAEKKLDWLLNHSDLSTIIKTAWEWHQKVSF
ncbi:MAG: UDP-glucose 4-epimerase GalE [Candidatus Aminicenantes bacterium 4484_214]|nr:MAG: UDP-glucose 4-epimerase GalE [Candidatus Aminicenantes bacterium 4484_214]RLE09646.1 MAG: UDP-glucose 4-epimerase GalE [Candidatus Aminicenantes bacterium]HDJ22553.1 UDP-glucose 4-epimerase GalE [Candidatus Aminicenantes bacterium]